VGEFVFIRAIRVSLPLPQINSLANQKPANAGQKMKSTVDLGCERTAVSTRVCWTTAMRDGLASPASPLSFCEFVFQCLPRRSLAKAGVHLWLPSHIHTIKFALCSPKFRYFVQNE
jgi:hypothetical protein